jgi:4-hydroxymandelate oxidase
MTRAPERATGVSACLEDLRPLAAAALPPDVWDFVEGGAGAEVTLRANRAALDAVTVTPRVLAGVTTVDTRAGRLGCDLAMPVAVAPMAYQRLFHPDGEPAVARAAAAAGVPFVLSTLASRTFADIAATGATLWFQLYWLRERATVERLLDDAAAVGCRALVLTVDVPVMGRRRRDVRNEFAVPDGVHAVNVDDGTTQAHRGGSGGSAVAAHTDLTFAHGLTWRDLEWLRARTAVPLVVKGLLDPRDARRAVDCGADGVVVSNHGGRQLDGAPPSVVALPGVLDAVSGECEVWLDSGVRSGTDVLRALAMGAAGVLLGRPVLWGLAADGEDGVARVFSLLRAELVEAMTLAGCADLTAAGRLTTDRTGLR